jgi:transposase InsO family protein
VPDPVKRDFSAATVDEKCCGDLTGLPTEEGKLYLSSVLDLASRRMPGFSIGEHHDARLAPSSLVMAAAVRGGDVKGGNFPLRQGLGVHRRPLHPGLQGPRRHPVDGPCGVMF